MFVSHVKASPGGNPMRDEPVRYRAVACLADNPSKHAAREPRLRRATPKIGHALRISRGRPLSKEWEVSWTFSTS
ncbi:hypothetical protein BVI2075_250053 [Burkholderia vietnamiensis]|nr:hypothetical protein BVI2075_250053 [Burkholderia vietnamiensis]CAG9215087.1 hypothetical protein BVI1335_2630008 [Burkholderia vietnamiensis]